MVVESCGGGELWRVVVESCCGGEVVVVVVVVLVVLVGACGWCRVSCVQVLCSTTGCTVHNPVPQQMEKAKIEKGERKKADIRTRRVCMCMGRT